MCKKLFLLVAVIVLFVGTSSALALYADSQIDFSSTQPAKWAGGWHYAVTPNWGAQYHAPLDDPTDGFYDLPVGGTNEDWPAMVVLNTWDAGNIGGDTGYWKYTGFPGAAGFNGVPFVMSARKQNYNTGNAESSVRYWVSDVAQTVNVWATVGSKGGKVSYTVRHWTYSDHSLGNYSSTDLGGAWEVTGTHSFSNTGIVMAAGDFITYLMHQSGTVNPPLDSPVTWHMARMIITPEPATIALLGLGGLFLRRRKH